MKKHSKLDYTKSVFKALIPGTNNQEGEAGLVNSRPGPWGLGQPGVVEDISAQGGWNWMVFKASFQPKPFL